MDGKEISVLERNAAKDGWWTHMFKREDWSGYKEMNREERVGKRCWESYS